MLRSHCMGASNGLSVAALRAGRVDCTGVEGGEDAMARGASTPRVIPGSSFSGRSITALCSQRSASSCGVAMAGGVTLGDKCDGDGVDGTLRGPGRGGLDIM